jgi:hypothetical protein
LNSVKINLPELDQLGYADQAGNDAMDVLQSKKGSLKNIAPIAAVNAGGNFTYYFGHRKKQNGISIGFHYSGFTSEYQLEDPMVYTFKASDGVNLYRRQITFNKLVESIRYNAFNFPVMYTRRFHLDKTERNVINIKVGPSFMLFSNSSSYNATVDFGGLYQVDTITKNAITYYNYFDRNSTYNVFFTSDSLNAVPGAPGASGVFPQLNSKGYDLAENKNYTGKQSLQSFTVAGNLALDFQHIISQGFNLKLGVHLVYAPWLAKKEKYKPLDKTTDEFNSIYNSNAKTSYRAGAVNVGFVYDF